MENNCLSLRSNVLWLNIFSKIPGSLKFVFCNYCIYILDYFILHEIDSFIYTQTLLPFMSHNFI